MKKYILAVICFISLLGISWATVKTPAARNSQNASVTFNGKKFHLQYSVGNQQMWLNEYLPTGVNFNNYTEMIAVRAYDGNKNLTPSQLAQIIAGNYAKKNPGVQYLLAANDKTGDGLVSFIMIEGNILEHNIYRTTSQNGTPISLQHVYRKYISSKESKQADMASFAKETRARRTEWINALDKMPVPVVVRTVKQ